MVSPRGHKASGETHDEEAALVIDIVDILLLVVDTLLQ
jgi:hypothetical protein